MHEKIIVAVDLGTSKITAAAGKKNDKGSLSILAVETTESNDCILRGRIYNLEETAVRLTHVLQLLNRKISQKIEKIYVGVGGQSVCSVSHSIFRELPEETVVSQKILDNMMEECLNCELDGLAVLSASSPEYKVDGRPEQKPLGVQCRQIEAEYQLIAGRPSMERDLQKVAEKAGISIAGFLIGAEATAAAVLASSEKDLGCVLVDFGAGVTTLSIYKNKLLKSLVTIPLGSSVITKDLMALNLTEQEAETFKITKGSAVAVEGDKENQVIEARVDEILANVAAQIKQAGFEEILPEGMLITGGGARLQKLAESIEDRFSCKVHVANALPDLFFHNSILPESPEYAQLAGLLALGKDSCVKEVEKPVAPGTTGFLFPDEETEKQEAPVRPVKEPKPQKEKEVKEDKPKKPGFFKNIINKAERSLFDEEL